MFVFIYKWRLSLPQGLSGGSGFESGGAITRVEEEEEEESEAAAPKSTAGGSADE